MRLHVFFVLTVCLTTMPFSLIPGNATETAREVQQIVAHRGASSDRPENTVAALRQAIKLKATAVEIDVRTSKDGELFLMHDAKVDRTTNGKGLASEMTMRQLKALDAGSRFKEEYRGERIPTLSEALEVCRGKIDVLLDLKEQGGRLCRSSGEECAGTWRPRAHHCRCQKCGTGAPVSQTIAPGTTTGLHSQPSGDRCLRKGRSGNHPPVAPMACR